MLPFEIAFIAFEIHLNCCLWQKLTQLLLGISISWHEEFTCYKDIELSSIFGLELKLLFVMNIHIGFFFLVNPLEQIPSSAMSCKTGNYIWAWFLHRHQK